MNRNSAIYCGLAGAAILLGCQWASTQAADGPKPAGAFTDPKPPKPAELKPVPAPAPKRNPDVTFHQKPKPLPAGATTHDWVSFLGPTHNAVSTETRLLAAFGNGEPKLVWEMRKGTGYTSPAIQGDRLVYFHRVGSEEIVECLHPETGERYWKFEYGTTFEDRYGYNNGPRSSPVIDGDRVYTYGVQGKLHCLKLDTGQVVWKRDIAAEFKVPQDFFGTATTPLIDDGRLILQIGAPGGPTVAAFDPETGKMLWGAGSEWGPSYASPVPATVHGRKRIFVFSGGESRPPTGGLLSIDPANGKIDVSFPWRSRSYESVNASTPLIIGNQVLLSATYRTGAALLSLGPAVLTRSPGQAKILTCTGTRRSITTATFTPLPAATSPTPDWSALIGRPARPFGAKCPTGKRRPYSMDRRKSTTPAPTGRHCLKPTAAFSRSASTAT